jgi:hypothetical protein
MLITQEDDLASNRHSEHNRSLVTGILGVASSYSRIQIPKEESSCPVTKVDLRQDDTEVRYEVEGAHNLRPRGLELESPNSHLHLCSAEQDERTRSAASFG